jgi:hypothetical protein
MLRNRLKKKKATVLPLLPLAATIITVYTLCGDERGKGPSFFDQIDNNNNIIL